MIASVITTGVLSPEMAQPLQIERTKVLSQIDAKDFARELLTRTDYKCFTALIGKESAWRNVANKHSSAKGVGQLLDTTYQNIGMKHSNEPTAQVVASLAYIGRKYGSGGPCAAWSHFKKHNWY